MSGFLFASCDNSSSRDENAPETFNVDKDTAAIHVLSEQVTQAYIARDWDKFAGYFTEDAIWMPNEVLPLQGKDEWWTFVEPFWDTTAVVEMSVASEEIVVAGDWAFERHTERQVIRPAGGEGETLTFNFKGIWLLQRQDDGSWKIVRYIWNWNPPIN